MKIREAVLVAGLAMTATLSAGVALPAFAQDAPVAASADVQPQLFFKKKYKIKGSWTIVERDGKQFVSFSDDFKTKNGPDLKIFLSPKSESEVNGKNAVEGSLNLGELKNKKGPQEYEIPAGTDLSLYSTVLVHCEAYAILWGGGAL